MKKIEQFIEAYLPHQEENLFPVEINENKLFKQKLKSLMDNWIKCSDKDPETIDYLLIVVDGDTLYGYWDGKEYQVMKGLGGYITVKPALHQPLPQLPKEK